MHRLLIVAAATGLFLAANAASAQLKRPEGDRAILITARVSADDVSKTADFYKAVFHMEETLRIEQPDLKEIILNFGTTVAEAKAAPRPTIAVLSRRANDVGEGIPHLTFSVGDIEAVLKRAAAQGGVVEQAPRRMPTFSGTIAFIRDPSGNQVELVMPD
ncbi:MAG: VOC family protein [Amphiplicatus sp.]